MKRSSVSEQTESSLSVSKSRTMRTEEAILNIISFLDACEVLIASDNINKVHYHNSQILKILFITVKKKKRFNS